MNLSVDCQLTIDYTVLVTRGAVLEKAIEELNLDNVLAGHQPPKASELLGSKHFQHLAKNCERSITCAFDSRTTTDLGSLTHCPLWGGAIILVNPGSILIINQHHSRIPL